MSFDLDRWQEAIKYGQFYLQFLRGEILGPLASYPDASDNSVVQCVYDTLDRESMYNDALYDEVQDVLDKWLVEDISSLETRMQLTELLADTYGFGC
jgi:hypothetical protein